MPLIGGSFSTWGVDAFWLEKLYQASLAALLAGELALVAVPRNLDKPDGSANFEDQAAKVRAHFQRER